MADAFRMVWVGVNGGTGGQKILWEDAEDSATLDGGRCDDVEPGAGPPAALPASSASSSSAEALGSTTSHSIRSLLAPMLRADQTSTCSLERAPLKAPMAVSNCAIASMPLKEL